MLAAILWYIILFLSIVDIFEVYELVRGKKIQEVWDMFWLGKYVVIQIIVYLIASVINDTLVFFYWADNNYYTYLTLIVLLFIEVALIYGGYTSAKYEEVPWGKIILAGLILLLLLVSPFIYVAFINPSSASNKIISNLRTNIDYGYPEGISISNLDNVRRTTWVYTTEILKRELANESSRIDLSTIEDVDATILRGEFVWVLIPSPRPEIWISGRPRVNFFLIIFNRNLSVKRIPVEIWWFKRNSPWRAEKIAYKYFQDYTLLQVRADIDDNLRPYLVLYLGSIDCFGIKHLEKIVIIDVTTPEERFWVYSPDNAPAWLEVIYPDHFIEESIDWWSQNRFGLWHAWFIKKDIYTRADWSRFVILNGKTYWQVLLDYTGSHVLSGYVLVNTRSGDTVFYFRGHLSYPDPHTVLQLAERYLKSGQLGYRELAINETYLYPIEFDNMTIEPYIIPLYSGIAFYGWMIIDSTDYTRWSFGRDLRECLEKLYGIVEEEKEVWLYNVSIVSHYIEDSDTVYLSVLINGSVVTYEIVKEIIISRGTYKTEKEWVELMLAVNSDEEYRIITLGIIQDTVVDVDWPYANLVP